MKFAGTTTLDTPEGTGLEWLPEAFYCGSPGCRCQYCGKAVVWVPAGLEVDACTCDRAPEADPPADGAPRKLAVKFPRPVLFKLPVSGASAARWTAARPAMRLSGPDKEARITPLRLFGRNDSSAVRDLPPAGPDGSPAPRMRRRRVPHAPPFNFGEPTAESPVPPAARAVGGPNVGNNMEQKNQMRKNKPRCAPDGASPPRPPETAALRTRPRQFEALDKVGEPACQPARLSNNAALSSKTSSRSVGSFLVKPLVFIAVLALVVKIAAQDVGEIAPRAAPQGAEAALSVLQNARNAVQQRLANIAAQADPLAEAVAAYKANPTAETALRLLHREAVVASIGARECEAIASEATTVARACAGLAAQTQAAAQMLRPGLDRATRARAEHAATRNTGFSELKEVHRTLVERGVTNEMSMSAAEKRKVAMLLRLTGAADLSERFLKMEVGVTEAVIARLNALSEQFAARHRNFQDLAEAYRLHAASFKTVGGSVAQVARLIEVNQRFDAEAKSAAQLETELARVDEVLGKTFDSLPDDFAPAITIGDSGGSDTGSTGLWARLLRFLGLVREPEPTVTETGGSSR